MWYNTGMFSWFSRPKEKSDYIDYTPKEKTTLWCGYSEYSLAEIAYHQGNYHKKHEERTADGLVASERCTALLKYRILGTYEEVR